jgi:hypothetical protein
MTSALNTILNQLKYVDIDMSAGKAKQNNLHPECGQPIDTGDFSTS